MIEKFVYCVLAVKWKGNEETYIGISNLVETDVWKIERYNKFTLRIIYMDTKIQDVFVQLNDYVYIDYDDKTVCKTLDKFEHIFSKQN